MQRHGLMPSNDGGELRTLEQPAPLFDSRARAAAQTIIAIAIVLLALWVACDFLVALAWAAVIAITAWPLYVRFAGVVFGGCSPTVAPLLFTLLTGLVLLASVVSTGIRSRREVTPSCERSINCRRVARRSRPWLAQLPIAGAYLDLWWRSNLGNPEVLVEWLRGVNIEDLTAWTSTLGGALFHRLFLFVITLIALFLVLRDGTWLADRTLATAERLLGNPGARLVSKVADATRAATVNGTVAAAIVKGAVIGIAYVLAGVPHPLLFAVLTMALAMVPLGAWVALATAALILPLQGGTLLAAAGLFGFGAAMLLIGDNFIQPALIGGTAQLPFLPVLIGILGGIESVGLVGLFLGPVIMAALLTVWREWIGVGD